MNLKETNRMLELAGQKPLIEEKMTPAEAKKEKEEEAKEEKISPNFEKMEDALEDKYDIDLMKYKDKMKGGMGDKKKPWDFSIKQVIAGIKVELEHTKDKYKALEIVVDHLTENPKYYIPYLEKMEKKMDKEKKKNT
jgi:hypothetical protein